MPIILKYIQFIIDSKVLTFIYCHLYDLVYKAYFGLEQNCTIVFTSSAFCIRAKTFEFTMALLIVDASIQLAKVTLRFDVLIVDASIQLSKVTLWFGIANC